MLNAAARTGGCFLVVGSTRNRAKAAAVGLHAASKGVLSSVVVARAAKCSGEPEDGQGWRGGGRRKRHRCFCRLRSQCRSHRRGGGHKEQNQGLRFRIRRGPQGGENRTVIGISVSRALASASLTNHVWLFADDPGGAPRGVSDRDDDDLEERQAVTYERQ